MRRRLGGTITRKPREGKKLPAIQFYPGDWKRDPAVQALALEERGAWFECLLLMHECEERGKLLLNGEPMPDSAVARNLGIPEASWKQIRSKLLSYGVASEDPDSGALINRRMVRDEQIRRARSEAGRKGGKKSRPPHTDPVHEAQPEAKRKQTTKQKGTSSSSSSSSKTTYPTDTGIARVENSGKPDPQELVGEVTAGIELPRARTPHAVLMPLTRQLFYMPDGEPPDRYNPSRDGQIIRRLAKDCAISVDTLEAACRGAAYARDHGLEGLNPGEKITWRRLLRGAESDPVDQISKFAHIWCKAEARIA